MHRYVAKLLSKTLTTLLSFSRSKVTCKITGEKKSVEWAIVLKYPFIYKLCGDPKAVSRIEKQITMITEKMQGLVKKYICDKQTK